MLYFRGAIISPSLCWVGSKIPIILGGGDTKISTTLGGEAYSGKFHSKGSMLLNDHSHLFTIAFNFFLVILTKILTMQQSTHRRPGKTEVRSPSPELSYWILIFLCSAKIDSVMKTSHSLPVGVQWLKWTNFNESFKIWVDSEDHLSNDKCLIVIFGYDRIFVREEIRLLNFVRVLSVHKPLFNYTDIYDVIRCIVSELQLSAPFTTTNSSRFIWYDPQQWLSISPMFCQNSPSAGCCWSMKPIKCWVTKLCRRMWAFETDETIALECGFCGNFSRIPDPWGCRKRRLIDFSPVEDSVREVFIDFSKVIGN